MKDTIKDLKRRAGILTEGSPLLMLLLSGVQEFAGIADKQGIDAAKRALQEKGFEPEQIEVIFKAYRDYRSRTGGMVH